MTKRGRWFGYLGMGLATIALVVVATSFDVAGQAVFIGAPYVGVAAMLLIALRTRDHRPLLKSSCYCGIAALLLHTLLALVLFIEVYHNRGVAQSEFAWFGFNDIDWPINLLWYKWQILPTVDRWLFDIGYRLVDSGPNFRAFVVAVVIGGVQWALIGAAAGLAIAWIRQRINSVRTRFMRKSTC